MKSIKKFIAVLMLISILVAMLTSLCACTKYPEDYTLEEHIDNITKRVQKKYMDDDNNYTSFTVYPLYDENDKLTHFLVEFEPYGFLFIHLGVQRLQSYFFAVPGMYMYCDTYLNMNWQRYRLCVDGIEPQPYGNHEWVVSEGLAMSIEALNARFESDEEGNIIEYNKSPYYISNVFNDKLYYLEMPTGGVPAIKNGDAFVNLVSMEDFTYKGKNGYTEDSMPPRMLVSFFYSDKL